MKDLSTICGNCGEIEGKHAMFGSLCPLPNGEGFIQDSTFEPKREPCPVCSDVHEVICEDETDWKNADPKNEINGRM